MVTAQPLSVISPNSSRERINQEDSRGDFYFRLSVARDQEQESIPQPNAENVHVQRNGVHRDKAAITTAESLELPQIPSGLSYLPLAGQALSDLEHEAIRQTLCMYNGNRKQSAAVLGISVRTLQRKIKEWNLQKPNSD